MNIEQIKESTVTEVYNHDYNFQSFEELKTMSLNSLRLLLEKLNRLARLNSMGS